MSLTDYLIYQKNKLVAGGDTQKEMELNRKEMELKEQRAMEKQVKEEQKRLVELERERARQEYSIKEARERERIKYEGRVRRAEQDSKTGGIFGRFVSGVEGVSKRQAEPRTSVKRKTKRKVRRVASPPKKRSGGGIFSRGTSFKWSV